MQLFQQPFDANKVKPQEAFEPLPAGWYNAKIVNSEAKPTKDNESGYLQLDLEVLDGEHKGRKLFDRLNLWNKSVQASEIAQRQLSAYCHATGVLILQDSAQLHGIPIKIKVSVKQDAGYEPSNEVKAVKHIQDSVPATAAPVVPFGQNPALPPVPTAGPSGFAPPAAPVAAPPMPMPPAASPAMPWQQPAQPAAPAPFVPPQAQPADVIRSQPAGPVPPWRR